MLRSVLYKYFAFSKWQLIFDGILLFKECQPLIGTKLHLDIVIVVMYVQLYNVATDRYARGIAVHNIPSLTNVPMLAFQWQLMSKLSRHNYLHQSSNTRRKCKPTHEPDRCAKVSPTGYCEQPINTHYIKLSSAHAWLTFVPTTRQQSYNTIPASRNYAFRKLFLRQRQNRLHRRSHHSCMHNPCRHQPYTYLHLLTHSPPTRVSATASTAANWAAHPTPTTSSPTAPKSRSPEHQAKSSRRPTAKILLWITFARIAVRSVLGSWWTFSQGLCWFTIGTPLYGGGLSKDEELETVVLRAGIFDDQDLLHQCKPIVEIYTSQRLKWVAPVEICQQFEGMLPSQWAGLK